MARYFNGKLVKLPQAVSYIDDSALRAGGAVGLNAVAVLGVSTGGQPNTPLLFSDPATASRILRSGVLLEGVKNAFDASVNGGAPLVYALRVNPAVQSSLTLVDGAAADVIDLLADDYGVYTNGIQIKIEAGSNIGKKISVKLDGEVIVKDDVGEYAFSIQYTGAGSAATMTIDATTLATTVTAGPGGEDLSLTLADYESFNALAEAVNVAAGGAYTMAVLAKDGTTAPNEMDYATGQDIKTGVYSHTQNLKAIVEYLNGTEVPFIGATRKSAVGTLPANISYTPFTGGSEGSVTNTNWQNGLDALKEVHCKLVVPMTGDATIHAMADAHAIDMSDADGKSERRAVVGGIAGETVAQAAARSQLIQSHRTVICYPGIKQANDITGVVETRAPFYLAAEIAGASLGVGIGEPLTNKSVRALGLETDITRADRITLQDAGVCCIYYKENGGYVVNKGITTWTADDKYNKVEISTGMASDEVAYQVREALEAALVGQKNSPSLLVEAASIVESQLKAAQANGFIVGDRTLGIPAYKNIQVEASGDTVYVSFEMSPAIPANFILITAHAKPFETV